MQILLHNYLLTYLLTTGEYDRTILCDGNAVICQITMTSLSEKLSEEWRHPLFCSLAVLDPRVGHTMDVRPSSLPLEVGPLNPVRGSGERC